MKSITQSLNILLAVSILLGGVMMLGVGEVEAKSAPQANISVGQTLTYLGNYGQDKDGLCPAGCWWYNALSGATVAVDYAATVHNQAGGAQIMDNTTIPVGTQIEFRPKAHQNTDIFWNGTGYSSDTPYGHWVAGAGVPPESDGVSACNPADQVPSVIWNPYTPLSIAPPTITYSHSGTASLTCNATGNLCTVDTPGSISASVNFGATSGKFYYRYYLSFFTVVVNGVTVFVQPCAYNNVPLSTGPVEILGFTALTGLNVAHPPYILPVPSRSVNFTLTAVGAGNNLPDTPTISGPTTGTTSVPYSFNFLSTDDDLDTLRYEIDWNNDGVPNAFTSYVPSGTTVAVSKSWPFIGGKTFKARALDSQGGYSLWSNLFTITLVDPVATLDVTPPSLDFGNVNTSANNPLQFIVKNTGGGILTGNVTPLVAPYSCVSGCSYTLGAGATQNTVIEFAPTSGVSGNKTDTVAFISDGGNKYRPVTGYEVAPLVATCSVAPASGDINTNTTWTANVTGGKAPYTYAWTGDAPLAGQTTSLATVQYPSSGIKTGAVTVTDSLLNTTGLVACSNSFNASNPAVLNLTSQALAETSNNLIQEGQTLTFTAEVLNNGTLDTGAGFSDVFEYRYGGVLGDYSGFSFLSSEGNGVLTAGNTDSDSTAFTIPTGSAGQTLFIQHCIDNGNAVTPESDESDSDNCSQLSLGLISVPPSGNIWFSPSCEILAGDSVANCTVSWNSFNFVSPASLVRVGTGVVDTGLTGDDSGSVSQTVPYGTTIFDLNDGGSLVSSRPLVVDCETGSIWAGGVCTAMPTISIIPDAEYVRSEQTADVTITINSGLDLNCTLSGALAGTFAHTGSTTPNVTYPPFTTWPLTSTRIARVDCVDSLLSAVTASAETRIEVIPTYQEI